MMLVVMSNYVDDDANDDVDDDVDADNKVGRDA